LRLFQNVSRELARNKGKQPPLIEIIELNDRISRGEKVELSLMDKKRLFVARHALKTVYFVAAPDAGMVKIGKTIDLEKRFANLQNMSPIPLKVACQIHYDDGLEYRIHQHFKEYRSHGEWFCADKPIVDFMRNYRDKGIRWVIEQVGDGPDNWMNGRGAMSEEMRDEMEWCPVDPDYCPNTQNKSGIDFGK